MTSQNTQSLDEREAFEVLKSLATTDMYPKLQPLIRIVEAALRSSTATAAQGEPVATKWAMYFSGEPENPQLKPGFMANWCLYSDVLSVQSECDKANESYAERDSATAGHKPYVARQVFIFANPPEPAGVVEAGTVGVSLYKPDGWTEAEEMQAGFALAALAHTPELAGFTFADNQWRHMCRVFSRADEMLDAQVEALAATSAKPAGEVSYVEGVEIDRLASALSWMGVSTSESKEELGARLSEYVNALTRSVMEHKNRRLSQPPSASPVAVPEMDLDLARAMCRSAGISLVSRQFIINFTEFYQDWRKGDFVLPKLAELDMEACFESWQKFDPDAATPPALPDAGLDSQMHPMQPLVLDHQQVIRFKENAIVRFLANGRLNELAAMEFSDEDRMQVAQLIGYSVDGYGTLSYVSDESANIAFQDAEPLRSAIANGEGRQS